ncbi:MAG: type II toxin-antitoxin system HicA family toxin [Dehalococcoidia bacterium]
MRRRLEATGFIVVSQTGSHVKFVRRLGDREYTVIVPRHREVAAGTLRSILRQAGLTERQFEAL